MKAATLESRFPLMAVEHGCIISKDADITVAYRLELPEVFTLTRAEYEALHSTWAKAVRVLPNYSIVHKQDIFIEESYRPDICRDDLSFLSRSFERHFNERPYLNHTCYLFLTKTTKEHSRTTSSFNALTRGFIIPKEMQDKDTVARFLARVHHPQGDAGQGYRRTLPGMLRAVRAYRERQRPGSHGQADGRRDYRYGNLRGHY